MSRHKNSGENTMESGKTTDGLGQCVMNGDEQDVESIYSRTQFSKIPVNGKQSTLKTSSISEVFPSAQNTMTAQDGSRCVIPL